MAAARAMACQCLSHPCDYRCAPGGLLTVVRALPAIFNSTRSSHCSPRNCSTVGLIRPCSYGGVRSSRVDVFEDSCSFQDRCSSHSGFSGRACFPSGRNRSLSDLVLARAHVSVEERDTAVQSGTRNVVDVLEERGLIESITGEELRATCMKQPLKVYCGFDPTAESLHLGNLLGIIVLSWFQRCGHVPVALLGGATARVGDPSGKSNERPVMDDETICRNLKGIRGILAQILKVEDVAPEEIANKKEAISGKKEAIENASSVIETSELMDRDWEAKERHTPIILNNYDWWKDFSLLDFLRDVGKYARVGTMMAKESVKKRLNSEEGMSYTEFTYQLLQGYDFIHLFKICVHNCCFRKRGVSVQIGGSDQWGNITAGTDLIRRVLQQEGAYGLTFPLLLKSDGSKFGKSEGGAIWLSTLLLSPYKFYQHLFATPDSDVIRFMKMLTFVDLEEIQTLEQSMGKTGYVANSIQKRLAEEVTRFVHGDQGLAEAVKATQALAPGASARLDWTALEAIAEDVPSCSLSQSSVLNSSLVDLCVSSGLLPSKAGVRRLIKQGGLYLNNEKVEDEGKSVVADDIVDGKMLLLSVGKKNKLVVRVV